MAAVADPNDRVGLGVDPVAVRGAQIGRGRVGETGARDGKGEHGREAQGGKEQIPHYEFPSSESGSISIHIIVIMSNI